MEGSLPCASPGGLTLWACGLCLISHGEKNTSSRGTWKSGKKIWTNFSGSLHWPMQWIVYRVYRVYPSFQSLCWHSRLQYRTWPSRPDQGILVRWMNRKTSPHGLLAAATGSWICLTVGAKAPMPLPCYWRSLMGPRFRDFGTCRDDPQRPQRLCLGFMNVSMLVPQMSC